MNEFGYEIPHPFVYLGQKCCLYAPTANGVLVPEAAESSGAKGKGKSKYQLRKLDSVIDTGGGKSGKKGSKDL